MLIGLLAILSLVAFAADEQTPVVPKEKTLLFNGTDLSGWKLFLGDPQADVGMTWKVKDGMIFCAGRPSGYMRTEKAYADYLLHVEWRWAQKPSNSGVLVHMAGEDKVWPRSIECQLMHENAGDFWVIDGTEFEEHAAGGDRVDGRNVKKLHEQSEKEPGQWNTYEIICKDDWIVVIVNGVVQNIATGCNVHSGRVCIQSEGAPIAFRNIYIEPLK
jgi:hypothetical protein